MKNIVIFGAPGSGKGTQSDKIIEEFGVAHISTGDVLRAEIKAGTELGNTASKYINEGKLVPDSLIIDMLAATLDAKGKDIPGVIFDGFPRTIAQAEALDAILAKKSEEVSAVVSIMIPDEMIVERIRHRAEIEGRADDASIETIKNRIATYHSQTEAEIDYYRKAGKYNEIDGTGSIEEVRERIFALVDRF